MLPLFAVTYLGWTAGVFAASDKAGISWPIQEATTEPVQAFLGSGSVITWFFDWNKNYGPTAFLPLTPAGITFDAEFVPTEYSPWTLNDGVEWQTGFKEVKGFNEPDLSQQAAADPITASEAYVSHAPRTVQRLKRRWKTMVDQVRAINPDVKLHSPAVAFNQTWLDVGLPCHEYVAHKLEAEGETWFDNVCPGWSASSWNDSSFNCTYAPDYVSVHAYRIDFDDFTELVTGYHTRYGLPVVVPEFAAWSFDSDSGLSQNDTSTYMTKTTQWMDAQDWIIKYAWFGAMRNPTWLYGVGAENRLMHKDSSLTGLYAAGASMKSADRQGTAVRSRTVGQTSPAPCAVPHDVSCIFAESTSSHGILKRTGAGVLGAQLLVLSIWHL